MIITPDLVVGERKVGEEMEEKEDLEVEMVLDEDEDEELRIKMEKLWSANRNIHKNMKRSKNR